ncbi:MAG: class I SAM-dependent methyltransferase [Candidatus Thorarchaeota archaeon]
MNLWQNISHQFGKPSGILGRLAGFIMTNRPSNIERNEWGISLLKINPSDFVLEIGFGPGLAISKISKMLSNGIVYGIDHSPLMLDFATKKNKEAIQSGRVKLLLGSASSLPDFENHFDKILDVNSFQFWENPVGSLEKLKEKMKPEGVIAFVHQPRNPGATDDDAVKSANHYNDLMKQAGFKEIRIEKKIMKPVATICVMGVNK